MFDHLVDLSTGISINNEINSCIVDIFIETGATKYVADLSKLLMNISTTLSNLII